MLRCRGRDAAYTVKQLSRAEICSFGDTLLLDATSATTCYDLLRPARHQPAVAADRVASLQALSPRGASRAGPGHAPALFSAPAHDRALGRRFDCSGEEALARSLPSRSTRRTRPLFAGVDANPRCAHDLHRERVDHLPSATKVFGKKCAQVNRQRSDSPAATAWASMRTSRRSRSAPRARRRSPSPTEKQVRARSAPNVGQALSAVWAGAPFATSGASGAAVHHR